MTKIEVVISRKFTRANSIEITIDWLKKDWLGNLKNEWTGEKDHNKILLLSICAVLGWENVRKTSKTSGQLSPCGVAIVTINNKCHEITTKERSLTFLVLLSTILKKF